MLNVKKVIPPEEYEAIYVTEENVKEFIEYAYPNKFDLDTLKIDRTEEPYIYALVKYSGDDYFWNEHFILNSWYMKQIDSKSGWFDEEYFENNYKIVDERNLDIPTKKTV